MSQLAADQTAIVSHDRGRTVAQNIIRRAIYAEDWTLVRIADASGIKLRALKSYFYEGKEPSYSSLSSIACVLGEWAVNMLLAPLGYKATPLDEPDDLQPQQVVADCLREFTVIAQACVDNRIDHSERPAVECAADAMIDKLLPLSSLAHAA